MVSAPAPLVAEMDRVSELVLELLFDPLVNVATPDIVLVVPLTTVPPVRAYTGEVVENDTMESIPLALVTVRDRDTV